MKRCSLCNDILMREKTEKHFDGEIIECFVCGIKYKIIMEWKTVVNENGMLETVMLPRLSLL